MSPAFADRMTNIHKSFIREILKVTVNPEVISFAGGLPNPGSFPVEELQEATRKVLESDGSNALQYSTTEGYLPLREYIAARYLKRKGLSINPDDILITTGSQQGLDLLGKVFINQDDDIVIERPGYLGAIQALAVFEPRFHAVQLLDDGIDLDRLAKTLKESNPKLFYAVPNFQNPSGITYDSANRETAAGILRNHDTIFIEDDPYGELRFMGHDMPSMKTYLGDNAVLLGSFSKIVAPGMRLGWVCAKPEIMDKLIVAKQAADLHTNYFSQRVVHQYLVDNDLDSHIQKIRALYKGQRDCMVAAIERYFPEEITSTKPEGGMFLWATLPEGVSSLELFDLAARENVAFVPGDPFYVNEKGTNTMRLNYTNSNETAIEEGIRRLANVIKRFMAGRRNG
ncbi:MAG: PLP-dependent aminotransferase family protein [Firmicutes bacterium]|nr:PLP-dependent aminotransferase family protein [Bacillota bacterium]